MAAADQAEMLSVKEMEEMGGPEDSRETATFRPPAVTEEMAEKEAMLQVPVTADTAAGGDAAALVQDQAAVTAAGARRAATPQPDKGVQEDLGGQVVQA